MAWHDTEATPEIEKVKSRLRDNEEWLTNKAPLLMRDMGRVDSLYLDNSNYQWGHEYYPPMDGFPGIYNGPLRPYEEDIEVALDPMRSRDVGSPLLIVEREVYEKHQGGKYRTTTDGYAFVNEYLDAVLPLIEKYMDALAADTIESAGHRYGVGSKEIYCASGFNEVVPTCLLIAREIVELRNSYRVDLTTRMENHKIRVRDIEAQIAADKEWLDEQAGMHAYNISELKRAVSNKLHQANLEGAQQVSGEWLPADN